MAKHKQPCTELQLTANFVLLLVLSNKMALLKASQQCWLNCKKIFTM